MLMKTNYNWLDFKEYVYMKIMNSVTEKLITARWSMSAFYDRFL